MPPQRLEQGGKLAFGGTPGQEEGPEAARLARGEERRRLGGGGRRVVPRGAGGGRFGRGGCRGLAQRGDGRGELLERGPLFVELLLERGPRLLVGTHLLLERGPRLFFGTHLLLERGPRLFVGTHLLLELLYAPLEVWGQLLCDE